MPDIEAKIDKLTKAFETLANKSILLEDIIRKHQADTAASILRLKNDVQSLRERLEANSDTFKGVPKDAIDD